MDRELLDRLLREGEITPSAYAQLTRPSRREAVVSQVLYLLGGLLLLFGLWVLAVSILRYFPHPLVFLLLGLFLAIGLAAAAVFFQRKDLWVPCLLAWIGSYLANWITAGSLPFLLAGAFLLPPSFPGGNPSLSLLGNLLLWGTGTGLGLLYVRSPLLLGANAVALFLFLSALLQVLLFGPVAISAPIEKPEEMLAIVLGLLYLAVGFFGEGRTQKDYSFWLQVVGAVLLSLGLGIWSALAGVGGALFLILQVVLAATGFVQARTLLVIISGIGFSIYLAHLVATVFANQQVLAGILLTALGMAVVLGGIALRSRLRLAVEKPLRGSRWL